MSEEKIWNRNEVQSPCVNICVMHRESGLCTGCLRTIDEILKWSSLDDNARRQVIVEIEGRKIKPKRRPAQDSKVNRN